MKAPLYNQAGEKKGDVTLSKIVFECEPSEATMHSYLLYQRANARQPIAHVKNKADVRGGGRKPFRQKGTGRARQGSIRNPHYIGGGVAFGPKSWRNFEIMMPKKLRRLALFSLLSAKAKDGKILALDKFDLEKPKSKEFSTLLKKLPIQRKVLVVATREEEMLKKSAQNLKNAKVILNGYLNPADISSHDHLLITEAALKEIETTYSK